MSRQRCCSHAPKLAVRCERESGHGGAHTATVDDPETDPDFTYVVSWWPKASSETTSDDLSPSHPRSAKCRICS